jgi:hypothetical protein
LTKPILKRSEKIRRLLLTPSSSTPLLLLRFLSSSGPRRARSDYRGNIHHTPSINALSLYNLNTYISSMGFLSYCFPSTSSTSPLLSPSPSPSPTSGDSQRPASPTYFLSCIFCNVHDNVPSSRLRYEDDEFLVFQDRSPGGLQHLLCVPRKHYGPCISLPEVWEEEHR